MKKLMILVVCFAAPFSLLAQSAKFALSGHVVDPNDSAIPGIQIEAYRNHSSVGKPVRSTDKGEYRVEYGAGAPLDTVRYDHSDWYPGVVDNISGKNDHTVHKVLYRRTQKLSNIEAEDVICAFERAAEMDEQNDTRKRSLIEYKYQEALEEIDKLPLPPDLKQRIVAIKKKYGIP